MSAAPTLALLEVLLPMARPSHEDRGHTHGLATLAPRRLPTTLATIPAGLFCPYCLPPPGGFFPMGGLARLSCFPVSQQRLHEARGQSRVVLDRATLHY